MFETAKRFKHNQILDDEGPVALPATTPMAGRQLPLRAGAT